MSEIYLCDTSIWVWLARRRAREDLTSRVVDLVAGRAVVVNDVIRMEVLTGCRDDAEFATNDQQFEALQLLPLRRETWRLAARLGFSLRRLGISAGLPDLVIAASAIEHDAIVLHMDSDFDLIAEHSDLQVESYAAAAN